MKTGPKHKRKSTKTIDGKLYVLDREYSTLAGAQRRIENKPLYKIVKYFSQYHTYHPWGYS